jgi:hypothetical protein
MSSYRDNLDVSDPYEAHAFFLCEFSCDNCGETMPPPDGVTGCDDASCCRLADQARALRWYVPAPFGPERRSDIPTCYCPECAAKLGFLG